MKNIQKLFAVALLASASVGSFAADFVGGSLTGGGYNIYEVSEGVWHAADGTFFTQAEVDALVAALTVTEIDAGATYDAGTESTNASDIATNAQDITSAIAAAESYADANDTFISGVTFDVVTGSLTFTWANGGLSMVVDLSGLDTDTNTFASISGTIITFADSSTFDLSTLDTDTNTFAAIAGTTITFADGSTFDLDTLDTNTFASISGNVITFVGGSTFDLGTLDTDTFASISGNVITFVGGSTFDLSTLDTNTFASISGNVITFVGGSTFDLATLDTDTQLSNDQVNAAITKARITTLLSGEYDSAGSAAQALTDAKEYADLNDTVLTEAQVDAFVANNNYADVTQVASDIAAAISANNGSTASSDDAAQTAAISALEALVGTTSVASQIAAGVLVENTARLVAEGLLSGRINANQGNIALNLAAILSNDTDIKANLDAITVLNGTGTGSVAADIAAAISTAAGTQSTTDATQTQDIADLGSFESVAAVTAVEAVAAVTYVAPVAEVLEVLEVLAVTGVTGVAEVLGSITGTYTHPITGVASVWTMIEISEGVWQEDGVNQLQTTVQGLLDGSETFGGGISNVTGSMGTTAVEAVAAVTYVAPVAPVAEVLEVLAVAAVEGVIGTEGTFTGTGELGEVAVAITNEQAARMAADAAALIVSAAADAALSGRIDTNATDIAANLAAIQSNDTDIAANLAAIQSNDTDITDLQNAVSSNDTDIATNASTIISNATDAQNALDQAVLDLEEAIRLAKEAQDILELAQNVSLSANQQAIADELTRATAAEGVIQSDVDANEVASDAADSVLRTDLASEVVARFMADADIIRDQAIVDAVQNGRLDTIEGILNDHEARISFLESLHVVDKSFSKVIDGPNGTKIVMHFDADGTQRGKARTLTFLENPVVHGEFDILWNDEGKAVNAITGKLVDPMTGLEFSVAKSGKVIAKPAITGSDFTKWDFRK